MTDRNKKRTLGGNLQKLLALGALVILYVFFAFFGRGFFSLPTFINILASSYYIGFMAIGVTFVIITGGIDLSIGTNMMCAALVGGVAYRNWGWSIGMALALSVVLATCFGLLNGIMIAKLKLPPFIATLGTMLVTQGFGAIVSKVQTMSYPTVTEDDGWFKQVFYQTRGRFPSGVVWLVVFFLIAFIVLNKTRVGRYTFAIGSNEEATRLSGVNVDNWKILIYTICGFFAGLAAIVYSAAYTSIIPGSGGGLELSAIAGVVIGGTSMAGGAGTMVGTMIGVYIMSVLRQGLMSMNLQGHWQTFFTGLVVIGAVLLDIYRNKKQAK